MTLLVCGVIVGLMIMPVNSQRIPNEECEEDDDFEPLEGPIYGDDQLVAPKGYGSTIDPV